MDKRKFLAVFSSALLLAACGNNEPSSTSSALTSDGASSAESSLLDSSSVSVFSDSSLGLDTSDGSLQSSVESELSSMGDSSIEDVSSLESSIESSEESSVESSEEYIDEVPTLVAQLKALHNYTLDVRSYLVSDQTDVYTSSFFNINDQAFYTTYYSAYVGLIYQKDQGYVNFSISGDNLYPGSFYCTNPNVGVSSLYDLVAENLFLVDYQQTDDGYVTSDSDIIAVATNFSGYIDSSWLIAPENVHLKSKNGTLVLDFIFSVGYIDPETADPTIEEGKCEITIRDIGTTTNALVESYIDNPTQVYESPSEWSEDDLSLFHYYYNDYTLPLVPSASYCYDIESKDSYDGVNLIYTDYACGDQVSAYGEMLIEDGFSLTEGNLYTKTVTDENVNKITTYTVEMVFVDPSTPSGMHTIGFYYPNGVFQMELKCRTKNKAVTSVTQFNEYIEQIGVSYLVPPLPFGGEVTRIGGFEDRTTNMNQLSGDGDDFFFFTSTNYMKVYIDDYQTAIEDAERYVALLRQYGFDDEPEYGFGTVTIGNTTWNDSNSSFVNMTDYRMLTEANYPGYLMFRYCIYTPDHYTPVERIPASISLASEEHISSYSITNSNGDPITQYDPESDEGCIYVSMSAEDPYSVSSIAIKEDPSAICNYDEDSGRFEIKPTNPHIDSITLVPQLEQSKYFVSVDSALEGGSIRLISPSAEGYLDAGDTVSFSISMEEGKTLGSVYLVEDPSYPITKNVTGANSYSFVMPSFNATISFTLEGEEPEHSSSDLILSSITVDPAKTEYVVDEEFEFEGTITANYSNGSSADVTSEATFSGYDMSSTGSQMVTVRYQEGDQFKTATFTIQVNPATVSTEVAGHSYTYLKRLAGADTTFALTFNDDGTGTYTRTPKSSSDSSSATIYFTYVQTGNSVKLILASDSDSFTNFSTYRPFASDTVGTTNETATVNENGSISITLYGYNGGSAHTETFAFNA